MFNYNLITNNEREIIFDKLMLTFVNMEQYDIVAKENEGAYVYQSEFIYNAQEILYSVVIKQIRSMQNDSFYIVWNYSTKYEDGQLLVPPYSVAQIDKENLILMLEEQLVDMVDDALCYFSRRDLFQYHDMFIFDKSFQWVYAITHEDLVDGNRMCFYAQLA